MIKYTLIFMSLIVLGCKPSHKMQEKHQHTNALIHESSPYLLQHAHNPVDWAPWNEETLATAKKENKLIIVSIGYAACHWCHVMEHESFEDSTVAAIMNEHFIPIKVDREERPDVDDVYMTACQLVSNRGCGWPLNAFALPDGRPVWAGTYFPKDQWINILNQFKDMAANDRAKLEDAAAKISSGVNSFSQNTLVDVSDKDFNENTLQRIGLDFLSAIDMEEGGRRGAPKFPMPNNYEFLLKYYDYFGYNKAKDAVLVTLDKMANGGIYDQIGGGFARYSVDSIWHVPHFEKMLYDNGQLLSLYAQAYKLTKSQRYADVIDQTITFAQRELYDGQGGFYSSLDADSEGEEGKFYVWTYEEVDSILGDDAPIYASFYSITKVGNWEHNNILKDRNLQSTAKEYDLTESEVLSKVKQCDDKMMAARDKRVRPGTDDKILTSWNALMLKGLLDAYTAVGNEAYLSLAKSNIACIKTKMLNKDGRLDRNYKDGRATINAFLDDYANTIDAFLRAYEVTFDETYLNDAQLMTDYVLAHFDDKENGYFYYTSDEDAPLFTRKKEMSDNVISASNSVMARNLYKLGELMYNEKYVNLSKKMMLSMIDDITNSGQPYFYSNWCQLYADMTKVPYEVAILGDNFSTQNMALQSHFSPFAIYLGGNKEGSLALLKDKLQEDRTMIYVCRNKVCKLHVEEVDQAIKLID